LEQYLAYQFLKTTDKSGGRLFPQTPMPLPTPNFWYKKGRNGLARDVGPTSVIETATVQFKRTNIGK
jgi:hypothetical protein